MEKDLTVQRSSYFSGSGCMMSPSCFPVHEAEEFRYSRIHNNYPSKRGRRWRRILRKFMKESKSSLYGSSKPTSIQYDPISYSQNFDDGSHLDHPRRFCHVFQDHVSFVIVI
ncbi:uncharacterized protein G2W53_036254 [Senna tora]|uniref:Uncharacterized protein n=1 Tax=Senna tora TaxID=362788 RepID=A0A834W8J8_9FABA|nr:uncharacterized protein G2W53_036254 [Senna tora]